VKHPVQLGRRATEPANGELREFYESLMAVVTADGFREAAWALCEKQGWPDNQTCRNILAWTRTGTSHKRWLIAVNLSSTRAQARVRLPWTDLEGRWWNLADPVHHDSFPRNGAELQRDGLYVDLAAWQSHIFELHS
jgi:hypothetical protein